MGSMELVSLHSSLNTKGQKTFAFHIRPIPVFQQLCLVRKEEIEASNSFDYATWTCCFLFSTDVRHGASGLALAERSLKF